MATNSDFYNGVFTGFLLGALDKEGRLSDDLEALRTYLEQRVPALQNVLRCGKTPISFEIEQEFPLKRNMTAIEKVTVIVGGDEGERYVCECLDGNYRFKYEHQYE